MRKAMPSRQRKAKSKKKSGSKESRAAAKGARRKLTRRKPSLLILECDSEKLARQSLSIAGELHAAVRILASQVVTVLVQTTSQNDLLQKLARCKEEHGRFSLIVVIGHSNPTGIRLTSENGVSWRSFAKWTETFEPKQMVLLACKAGQMLPAGTLFEGITSLEEIYASPTYITKEQCKLVVLLILHLLSVKSQDPELLRSIQMLNFMLTLGVIFRWTRKEYRAAGFAEAVQWNLIQHLLDEYIQGIR
jgi:hypothetical protein